MKLILRGNKLYSDFYCSLKKLARNKNIMHYIKSIYVAYTLHKFNKAITS